MRFLAVECQMMEIMLMAIEVDAIMKILYV